MSLRIRLLSVSILAVVVLVLATGTAMAQKYIYGRADFATGLGPAAVVQADFNGDGRPDVAIVNSTANTVSILLGQIDGTLGTHVDYATGLGPVSVCVGDFNKDGKLDLAVANKTAGTVSILLGTGTGTFSGHVDYTAGSLPSSVAVGDFNNDTKPDLVVTNATNPGTVSILLNSGTGTFPTLATFATGVLPVSVAVGDLNGDGKLDLAVANNCGQSSTCSPSTAVLGTVSVLTGTGTGTFNPKVDYVTGLSPQAVIIGDFNGDGALDLAVANMGSNTVSILLDNNAVKGTFEPKVDYTVGAGPASLTARDLNGDGVLDLVVANENANRVSVLAGNGDGTFIWRGDYGVGPTPTGVTTGDFNADGLLDLAVANSAGNTVSVLLGQGGKGFSSRADNSAGLQPQAVAVGDFNGDGKPDLAVVDQTVPSYPYYGQVTVLLGNGDGTFTATGSPVTTDNNPVAIATGDFNNDGVLDLAVANYSSNDVNILLGNRDGTFTKGTDVYSYTQPISIATGHFDNDANLDLAVVAWGSNVVNIYLGNGDGTFRSVQSPGTDTNPSSVAVGDFNGDGILDLAVANYFSQTVTILLGNGDGTFSFKSRASTGSGPISVAVGDFNRDGILDLAVANRDSNSVTIMLGTGGGTFTPQPPAKWPATGSTPVSVAAGDFNGDGKLDLVVTDQCGSGPASVCSSAPVPSSSTWAAYSNAGAVSILLGNGDGTFQDRLDYAVGDSPLFAAVGTFSKDSAQDIVVANHSANTVSVLLATPVAALSSSSLVFSGLAVGTSFSGGSVTLSNPGTAQLNLASILTSGDFAETDTCGSILKPGKNCVAYPTFTPTQKGTREGTLTFTDNAPTGTQTVALTGTGLAAGAGFSPNSLTFASQMVGGTSAAKTVTLTNYGDNTLTIASIATTPEFNQTNGCGSFVNAGANCTISVTFTPAGLGTRTGVLEISDNAGNGQQDVPLTGTGSTSASPVSGGGSIVMSPIVPVNSLPSSPAPTNPPGTKTAGDLRTDESQAAMATEEAADIVREQSVPPPEPVVTLSTQALPFGRQRLHATSAAQTLTLTNTGQALLEVRGIATSAQDFAQTNNCGFSLAAGASCTIRITFAPQQQGRIKGYISIDAGTDGPHKVLVFGEGTGEEGAAKSASPGHHTPSKPPSQ